MEIDTAMAARFLTALSGDCVHTFQTFAEANKRDRACNRILHGTFARHAVTLQSLNLKGAGVFVMVNRGDCMGRKADNVTGARALFLDLDGAPLEPVLAAPLPPRIVVESSPDKWHAYWPIVDLPTERFTPAQKQLAERFDGDAKVHDRPRVMRLPGFLHNKSGQFQSRLVTCESAPLTWAEMVEAFGLVDRFTLPATIPEGERNNAIFKLAKAAANKAVPEAAQLARARKVNATRCVPPLADAEVAAIVARAYKAPRKPVAGYPRALLDHPAFVALDDSARLLMLLAYVRADSFNAGCVTLPWSELSPWFTAEKRFERIRKRALASGLMTIAKAGTKAMPRKGRGPTPNHYQLAIPLTSEPYSPDRIPLTSEPPEALQVLAVGSPEGRWEAEGANDDAKPAGKRVGS